MHRAYNFCSRVLALEILYIQNPPSHGDCTALYGGTNYHANELHHTSTRCIRFFDS